MQIRQFVFFLLLLISLIKCDNTNECTDQFILEEACGRLKAENGQTCIIQGGTCTSSYKDCTSNDETTCLGINLNDFRYECKFNEEENQCYKYTKKCSDYSSLGITGANYCESLSGENSNKRCVFTSSNLCEEHFNE